MENKKSGPVKKKLGGRIVCPVLPVLVCLSLVMFVITVIVNCENPVIKQWYESKEPPAAKPRPHAPSRPVSPPVPVPPPGVPLPAGLFSKGSINLGVIPAVRDRYEIQGLWFNLPGGQTVRARFHRESSWAGRWETDEGVPNRATVELRLPNGEVLNFQAAGRPGSPDLALQIIPIGSAEELAAIRRGGGYPLDGRYLQYTGIDLGSISNWEPIGGGAEPFTGIYNGGNHPITGLQTTGTISNPDTGLFGTVGEGGRLLNIRVTGGKVSGFHNVGGICGINSAGLINNCSFQGRISGLQHDKANAGGIAGLVLGGNIVDSTFEGELDNKGFISGGITALATDRSNVRNCVNRGKIQSELRAGGIVGVIKFRENGKGEQVFINDCRNYGTIQGKEKTGGIVGEIDTIGIINACYNNGEISGEREIGGIIGRISSASVTACRNDGTVKAGGGAGGIAAYNNSSELIACYNTGWIDSGSPAGGITGISEDGRIHACYNTGQVGPEDLDALTIVLSSIGWIAGEIKGPEENLQACYWLRNGPPALNGIGNPRSNRQAKQFNTGEDEPDEPWPAPGAHQEWGTGEGGSGRWWKTLGRSDGSVQYPILYWE